MIGGHDVQRRQDRLQDRPDRLGPVPQTRMPADVPGGLRGRGQVPLVQVLGLALDPGDGRGGRLQIHGEDGRAGRQRRLLGLQCLLLCARTGRLAFQRVGFGLEAAELVGPGRRGRVQCLRGAGRVTQGGRERGLQRAHGVRGPPLQGIQVELFDDGEDLAHFPGGLVVTAGQVLGQADVAGCRIEAQVRQGTGAVVHRTAPARRARL